MKQLKHRSTYFIMIALMALLSCGQNKDKKQSNASTDTVAHTEMVNKDSVVQNGNITTTISTDINQLGRLLDFKTYKPTRVKFKYTFIDNSGQQQRISAPGPSGYSLQALLYFDSLTFEKLLKDDRHSDYPSPNFNQDEFKFDWLDNDILTALANSKQAYHGHPNFFFGEANAKAWYLDKKILISKWSN